ncbi:hypothetical protein EW146_g6944 [Bondarzewia mesenterica]|uniref:G-protein coupled receptors family 1 profile domain-containing protein n=1 Tax=Bondarzewia mesenterica TaxID=1095465 RepID=A0A4S4LSU8_9AGAM|nr:hypothetical protein EW146_g6944 [Bondarzewia mesenterica]
MDFIPSPPPGTNYIAAIRTSLTFVLVLTPLGAILVPVILIILFFSTAESRRHPVFVFNILACCSGICEAALNAVLEIKQILYPDQAVSKSLLTATIATAIVSPVFIDSILLFRFLAFFPRRITSYQTYVAILALPLLIKCGRFITVLLYLNSFTHTSGRLPSVLLAAESTWLHNPYIMTEWSLQMVDNFYASSFFLYKLYQFRREGNDGIVNRSRTLLSRIRSLFLIALGNFILPVIMNIASIILIATDSSYLNGSYVLLSNNYVAILGIVFATIWTNKQSWNRHTQANSDSSIAHSTFDPAPAGGMKVSAIRFNAAPYVDSRSEVDVETGARSRSVSVVGIGSQEKRAQKVGTEN